MIEIEGLEVPGFHGALEVERRRGQRFVFDIQLTAHDAGVRSDKLADTVDYTEVVALIRDVSDQNRFNLIEALAASVADALIERFPISRARVRVRKPEVRLDAPVEFTAATVERTRR
ncbi:MAG: dihydroneopterin aldolase [Actinobacteria bacterium]|nr:MAG: dihydroneopterin aldolase [Actinomycetota bacterium]